MAKFCGAVYPPPSPDLPEVAIIVANDHVLMAKAVSSVAEGERLITVVLQGMKELAEENDMEA